MEGRRVFEDLTVDENLTMGGYTRRDFAGLKRDRELCFDYFPRLRERRRQIAGYLSGGEQQMLAISRALMARPRLILLDEPSLGLAPLLVQEIFRIVAKINAEEKTTFLLVEQNANVALSIAHFGYIMENGRIVLEGDPEKLKSNDDVPALQAADPPFGGLVADPALLQRVFASPGPILDPQGAGDDFWRFRMALAAAGFARGDVAINSASYHLTPLGFMLDNAARSLGCVVVPAGTGQTDVQVRTAHALRAAAYLGTPSFLYTLVKRGRELGLPLQIEIAFVTAEMLPESLRSELASDFGV